MGCSIAVKRANKLLSQELSKQVHIIYPAAAVVLWQEFGWRKKRIMDRFATSQQVADEAADWGLEKSLIQMFEEETGIEMQLSGYEKSYHDFSYLDGKKYNGEIPTTQQALYIKAQQKKWLAPLILSGLCISLHRDDGFGVERLTKFISGIDAMRREYGENPKKYIQRMTEVTTIRKEELTIR